MKFYSLSASKATSTARYNAFDPGGIHDGEFEKCLGAPVMVTIIHNPSKKNKDVVYENIDNVSSMQSKMASTLPPLVNAGKIFTLDDPDMEMFNALPKFIQEKITSNLEFAGSKLEALLKKGGGAPTPPKQEKEVEAEDDRPF